MEQITFKKMHGLGNDFVVIDGRDKNPNLTPDQLRAIGDRHRGVGYDQLVVLEPDTDADVFMRIYNSDGTEAEACGNATRCVAHLTMAETGKDKIVIETVAGLLNGHQQDDGIVVINMGTPRMGWQDIPLAKEQDTEHVGIAAGPLSDPVAVNMGNPHLVFFVDDAEAIDLEKWGPVLEHDPMLPNKANISVASVNSDGSLRLRVWERGVGITLACGSAACATIVAAFLRGLTKRKATLHLNGGPLYMEWQEDGTVLMGGAIAYSFDGVLSKDLLTGTK
ncbi:diaminopimelate epimerase [Sneathiella sp. P13V-1]|uniref:diaminopimelate epimerase n=1 Tax=Sneathiella sp. P13V-1 TaxID=2697366 RepID=UPI00187B981C|nr:diaminopimelate epimerase [Sneathiella sp. P13V-1]MBE7636301.1 diaminopimelate epimerase [Sneathiella sp. P13V-1]